MQNTVIKRLLFALLAFLLAFTLGAATLINLATQVKGLLAIANGGTGTASPAIVAGTNVTVSGSWPNQTINATSTGGGGSISNGVTFGGTFCTNASVSGGGNTMSCSSLFNVVAHQLIVAFCGDNQVGGNAMSDSGPGGGSPLTWNTIASVNNATATNSETAFWADPGAASGSDTFTCTRTNTSSFNGLAVFLVIGATLASPVDASTTKAAAGTQQIDLSTTAAGDLVMFGLENSGTATNPTGFFLGLNNTGTANSSGWAPNGPYHFQVGMGTNGSLVAVAIH